MLRVRDTLKEELAAIDFLTEIIENTSDKYKSYCIKLDPKRKRACIKIGGIQLIIGRPEHYQRIEDAVVGHYRKLKPKKEPLTVEQIINKYGITSTF